VANSLKLTSQAMAELSSLDESDRRCFQRLLEQLASGSTSGLRLWGHEEVFSAETPSGLRTLYRLKDTEIQVLGIEAGSRIYVQPSRLRLSAVVLAGGQDSYAGSRPLSSITDSFIDAGIDDVVVVVGRAYDSARRELEHRNITLVANPEYDDCMSRSLRCGLKMLPADTSAVLLSLGNRPFITAEIITRLIRAFKTHTTPIIVPAHDRMRGHPVMFDSCLLPELMQARGSCGGRAVLQHHPAELTQVEFPDAGVLERVWVN
jgi:CTP:molybdopterin cytidylyltransferase MocA